MSDLLKRLMQRIREIPRYSCSMDYHQPGCSCCEALGYAIMDPDNQGNWIRLDDVQAVLREADRE